MVIIKCAILHNKYYVSAESTSLIVRWGSLSHKTTGDVNSKINSYSAYLETLFFPRNQHQNFKIKNIPRVSWGGAGRRAFV